MGSVGAGPKDSCFIPFCLEEVVPDDHQGLARRDLQQCSIYRGSYGELSPALSGARPAPRFDPVLMIRMLILGYAFGLRSERLALSRGQGQSGVPLVFAGL